MAKRKNLEDAAGKAAATVDDAAAKPKRMNLDDAAGTAAANVNDTIHRANNVYPKILKDFLECPHCKFIGADVKQDTTRLENDYGIFVRNAVDLQPIGISMGIGTKRWRPSLEKLAKRLLLADMDKKNKDFLHATWGREDLTHEHIAYAAIDAFASAELAKPMNIKVDNLV
ncbi:hypothetical protein EJB05_33104, partial [Eragrostis curvula]